MKKRILTLKSLITLSIYRKVFFEDVIESYDASDHHPRLVVQSNIRKPTFNEIRDCWLKAKSGKCPHTIIKDEAAYMYDIRSCAVCGQGLGVV